MRPPGLTGFVSSNVQRLCFCGCVSEYLMNLSRTNDVTNWFPCGGRSAELNKQFLSGVLISKPFRCLSTISWGRIASTLRTLSNHERCVLCLFNGVVSLGVWEWGKIAEFGMLFWGSEDGGIVVWVVSTIGLELACVSRYFLVWTQLVSGFSSLSYSLWGLYLVDLS